MLDYYEVLQVSPRAEQAVIEAAYRRLAQKYHPDRNPDPVSLSRMQEINQAYSTLRDPLKRQQYDLELQGFDSNVLTAEAETEFVDFDYDWNNPAYQVQPQPHPLDLKKLGIIGVIVFCAAILFLTIFSNFYTGKEIVTVNAGQNAPVELLFYDNFDMVNSANWLLERPWHLTEKVAASGSNSLWIGNAKEGRYSGELNATAVMVRPIDLTATKAPALVFRLRGQTDDPVRPNNQDRLMVEVAEPNEPFQNVYTFSGALNNWEIITVDLSNWKGKTIYLRFRFQSGLVTQGFTGTYIDDVQVRK
jgi:DnaJ domain